MKLKIDYKQVQKYMIQIIAFSSLATICKFEWFVICSYLVNIKTAIVAIDFEKCIPDPMVPNEHQWIWPSYFGEHL